MAPTYLHPFSSPITLGLDAIHPLARDILGSSPRHGHLGLWASESLRIEDPWVWAPQGLPIFSNKQSWG